MEDYIIEPILNLSISEEHLGADAVAGMLSRLVRVWQVRGGAAEAQLCAQNTPTGCACVCVMSPTQRARGVGAAAEHCYWRCAKECCSGTVEEAPGAAAVSGAPRGGVGQGGG